jgi:hypothetical protein
MVAARIVTVAGGAHLLRCRLCAQLFGRPFGCKTTSSCFMFAVTPGLKTCFGSDSFIYPFCHAFKEIHSLNEIIGSCSSFSVPGISFGWFALLALETALGSYYLGLV